MNKQKWLILAIALVFMAGTAGALVWLKANQRLGEPGIRATPLPGKVAMKLELPKYAAGFDSTNEPESNVVLDWLPKDTSFAQRRYFAPDGFWVNANIILMGADRTSIHRPEFCMPGQGWHIDKQSAVQLPIAGPDPYELSVNRWQVSNAIQAQNGQKVPVSGLYVFWYVAHDKETASHDEMMASMMRHLLRTGELQRWAYVSYFAICAPGQEDATFERMKKLIVASVPDYQLPPRPASTKPAAQEARP